MDQFRVVLAHNGIAATLVDNVRNAIQSLGTHITAFLLLDLDLDGSDLFLDAVVTNFYDPTPYLVVTGEFLNSSDRINILNRGADICLGKPIDPEEVAAMINAVLRRATRVQRKGIKLAPCITRGKMVVDPLRRIVVMEGRKIELTTKEFDILYFLASYPGIVFSRDQIYECVWNDDPSFATTNVFDHISSLRKKLGLDPKDTRYIETVFGSGYRFSEK